MNPYWPQGGWPYWTDQAPSPLQLQYAFTHTPVQGARWSGQLQLSPKHKPADHNTTTGDSKPEPLGLSAPSSPKLGQ